MSEGVIWSERVKRRDGEGRREVEREREREDAASGKWLLQPQAYPDTPKRHQGGERESESNRARKREED